MALLYPTLYRNRITDITVEDLRTLGVRGLLLDVDNTLTFHGSQHLSDEVKQWLQTMRDAGFLMTVVSNSWEWRVAPFARRIGMEYTYLSCKPLPFGFLRGAHRMGLKRKECVAIGDQVFTDIIGANLCGVPCIQLQPIELEQGKPILRFKRRLEKRIYESRKGRGQ